MSTSSNLPGLRRPTADEQAWIGELWGAELESIYTPTSGKFIRYVGIFFLCFGVASSLRGSAGLTETVILLIVTLACFGFYCLNRYSDKVYRNRINAVKNGNYLVAPAVSVEVRGGDGTGTPGGIVRAELPDGQRLKGTYPIPSDCAQSLLRQNMHRVPILLIQIANDSEILAIPVQR